MRAPGAIAGALSRHTRHSSTAPPSCVVTRRCPSAVDAMHAQIAAEFPGTVIYMPPSWMFDKLCTSTTCGAHVPGTSTMAYVDQNHLSTAGALYLGSFLNCYLRQHNLLP